MYDKTPKRGNPRSEKERKARHKMIHGTDKLPPRGTGRGMGINKIG